EVVLVGKLGDLLQVAGGEHATGRILGRVDDDQAGARRDLPLELVDVEAEVIALAERDRHRSAAGQRDQRGIDRIAGVGDYHLHATLDQGKHGEEEHVLRAGDHDHLLGLDIYLVPAPDPVGDRLPGRHQAARRGVVRV